jgi:ketosteroid isomerase-like protein
MGGIWTIDEMQAFFEGNISDHSITISDIAIEVAGDGAMAWSRFSEKTQYKFDGNPVEEQAIFTAIFKKVGGDWKMAHLHRSAVPQGGIPGM